MRRAFIAIVLLSLAGCVQSEVDDSGTAAIGVGGGTLSLADGTAVEIPRGAVPREMDVTIRRKWEGAGFGSGVSAVSPVYELLPEGATFAVPIVITLALSPESVPAGSEIRIMAAPAGTSAFTELPTEILGGNRVRASTLHFGKVLVANLSSCRGNGPCNDGNACTFNDRCVKGQCRGTPYTCDDGNVCTNNVCDGAGGCAFPPNSAPCDDGNACTRNDTCARGICAGTAFTCDDGNPCTDDVCNGSGCTFTANSAPCDDGNACTSNDVCSAGVCRGSGFCCSPGPETNCNNGIDDDCDGLVDSADPDCQSSCVPVPEQCSNGVDDDCDGLIDAADPDCVLLPCGADECPFGYLCFGDFLCHSHCEDGAPDYDESDSDCGGADCPRCQAGLRCFSGFDCASGNCVGGICQ